MSGNTARLNAISETIAYKLPEPINFVVAPTGDLYGANVFSLAVMKERARSDDSKNCCVFQHHIFRSHVKNYTSRCIFMVEE